MHFLGSCDEGSLVNSLMRLFLTALGTAASHKMGRRFLKEIVATLQTSNLHRLMGVDIFHLSIVVLVAMHLDGFLDELLCCLSVVGHNTGLKAIQMYHTCCQGMNETYPCCLVLGISFNEFQKEASM